MGNSGAGKCDRNLSRLGTIFYRTAAGAEIDLLLMRGQKRIAIECKASTTPTVSRGFWNALKDLDVDEAWIIAPVAEGYPFADKVWVKTLPEIMGL